MCPQPSGNEPGSGAFKYERASSKSDDRLRVDDVAGRDEFLDSSERDPLDDEVLLLDSVGGPSARRQLLGEKADRKLVAEARRVVETAELGEALGLLPDLLGELPSRAVLR